MEADMKKELSALALAGTLMVPHITPTLGSESTVDINVARPAPSQSASWKEPPLPPVPYLDTMPWLASGSIWREPQIDSTWRPDLNTIGPIELHPDLRKGWFLRTNTSGEALPSRPRER
jgi:hypothetical protein